MRKKKIIPSKTGDHVPLDRCMEDKESFGRVNDTLPIFLENEGSCLCTQN
jgi:hypothetical protein